MTFERQLENSRRRLYSFAMRLCHNHHMAEDLVQTTMIKAFTKQHMFEEGSNLNAWLFTILRNEFLGVMRKNKRVVEDGGGHFANMLIELPDQIVNIEIKEFEELFAKLPENHRVSIKLILIDGLTYEEASEVLKVKVGTLKSRVSRGRELLKEVMTTPEIDQVSVGVMTKNDNIRYNYR